MDPTIIRVLFIVFAVMGGAGALIYLAMWLVVPDEPKQQGPARAHAAGGRSQTRHDTRRRASTRDS